MWRTIFGQPARKIPLSITIHCMFAHRKGIHNFRANLLTSQIPGERISHLGGRQNKRTAPIHGFASCFSLDKTDWRIEQRFPIESDDAACAAITLLQIGEHRQRCQCVDLLRARAQPEAMKEVAIPHISTEITIAQCLLVSLPGWHDQIAKIAKIFIDIERTCRRVTKRPNKATLVTRAMSLRGIFDDLQMMPLREIEKALHRRRIAIEVWYHYGTSPSRERSLHRFRVNIEGARVDIDKNDPVGIPTQQSGHRHSGGRTWEGEIRAENFDRAVFPVCTDPIIYMGCPGSQRERIRPRFGQDHLPFHLPRLLQGGFELVGKPTKDILAILDHAINSIVNLRQQGGEAGAYLFKGDTRVIGNGPGYLHNILP